uniref:Uncharacterized protein n=1 Tax=Pyxicephalus adspersus TaxID=30357 RepID=A0AAV2ZR04_PYXAD|nr:TPA: hypothetical protein GDO54_005213 [Pyxicephalus adspersus]
MVLDPPLIWSRVVCELITAGMNLEEFKECLFVNPSVNLPEYQCEVQWIHSYFSLIRVQRKLGCPGAFQLFLCLFSGILAKHLFPRHLIHCQ